MSEWDYLSGYVCIYDVLHWPSWQPYIVYLQFSIRKQYIEK